MENISKKDWISAGVISLFFSYTVIFSACLSSYMTGVNEFWFSICHFILPLVLVTLGVWGVTFVLCIVARRFLQPILFGTGVCAWLQLNVLNANYGVLDGTEIEWSAYGNLGVVNIIIWIVIICALLVMFKNKSVAKGTVYAGALLIVMQTSGILLSCLSNESTNEPLVFSTKGINEVGDHDNIVLIILDSLDVEHVRYLTQFEPELCGILDGFVFYENAVSPYTKTETAVPYVLTGQVYKNEIEYNQFLIDALEESQLLNELYQDGYDMGIYTRVCF